MRYKPIEVDGLVRRLHSMLNKNLYCIDVWLAEHDIESLKYIKQFLVSHMHVLFSHLLNKFAYKVEFKLNFILQVRRQLQIVNWK